MEYKVLTLLNKLHVALVFSLLSLLSPVSNAAEVELTFEKFHRLNKPLNRSDSGDWLGLSFQTEKPQEKLSTFLDADVRFYFQDDNDFNYSVQEGYVIYRNADYQFTLGRRILDWNINEKYWSLGYLNGLQSFTLLSTEEEGVTGLLYTKKIGRFEFDLLGSYLYIPQINPGVEFKNGEVKSKSEWVRLPPKKTVISGVEVPIHYMEASYQVSKIIFNKSLGANVRYNWTEGGVAAFAIYKPENRLRINAEAYYDNITTNKVIVTPDPTINHHAYYGIQIFQSFGDVKARGGFSYVDPNAKLGKDFLIDISNKRKKFESEYFTINPRYEKEAYAHMSLNYDKHRKYKLTLNYIHLLTKNTRGNDDFFSDAVKWQSTFGGGIQYYFNDSFNAMVDLKYDIKRKDNILKFEVAYEYMKQITLSLGLEVLKAPDANSYWSYYRTADTLYSSVGFIF